MPSSDPITIPKILKIVDRIQPKSILDVGCGNGRFGFLFREALDWNFRRISEKSWQIRIDGIEIEPRYVNPVHHYVYDRIFIGDWLEMELGRYDLIFLGDVLEHFPEGDWQKALVKSTDLSRYTIVVSPNWTGSIKQGTWGGNGYEKHHVLLSPQKVGGKCIFANSKLFICVFDNADSELLDDKDLIS